MAVRNKYLEKLSDFSTQSLSHIMKRLGQQRQVRDKVLAHIEATKGPLPALQRMAKSVELGTRARTAVANRVISG